MTDPTPENLRAAATAIRHTLDVQPTDGPAAPILSYVADGVEEEAMHHERHGATRNGRLIELAEALEDAIQLMREQNEHRVGLASVALTVLLEPSRASYAQLT
jgi:hypothetical protein